MKKIILLFFIFLSIFNLSFGQILSINKIEKLWYFKEEKKSRKSLFQNYKKIDILAPQTFYLRYDEIKKEFYIESNIKQDIIDFAKEKNIKVLPLLANISYSKKDGLETEYFDRAMIHKLLNDKVGQEKIIKDMINIVEKYNISQKPIIGWQLDLEAIDRNYKDKFTEFTKLIKKVFSEYNLKNKVNLQISAAIVSKISDNKNDYEKNYWDKWASAYDYKKLGGILDFITVMAYDQPQSKGPVATIDWSKKVLKYSLENIPKEKISFGIPVYAWAYRSEDLKNKKKHFMMINFELVNKYLNGEYKNLKTGEGKSEKFGNIPWVSYDRNKINYTIWYEDKLSFLKKLENINSANIHSFSVWALGDEDPKIWDLF